MEKVVWGGCLFERVPEGWLQYIGPVEADRFGDIRERVLGKFGGSLKPAVVFRFPNLRWQEQRADSTAVLAEGGSWGAHQSGVERVVVVPRRVA